MTRQSPKVTASAYQAPARARAKRSPTPMLPIVTDRQGDDDARRQDDDLARVAFLEEPGLDQHGADDGDRVPHVRLEGDAVRASIGFSKAR